MIHVDKDFGRRPTGLTFHDLEAPLVKRMRRLLTEKEEHAFDSHWYRNKSKAPLFELYRYKCAYCEGNFQHSEAALEIDHYRPKSKVTGTDHVGYYWLAYEWSNLLPACKTCKWIQK